MKFSLSVAGLLWAGVLGAHPMGSFSVSHYGRIEVAEGRARIRYVLDLAEVPTVQLLEHRKLEALELAREWARGLKITSGGQPVEPRLVSATATVDKGALRVVADLELNAVSGELHYQDANYPDRAGWKEIVIGSGPDRSHELTSYPPDAVATAPQDLEATVTVGQPRGTALAQLLHRRDLGLGAMLLGLAVAFGLGAVHALSPGHGKTIVAAYLVGSRGTPRHALFLGGMVTFTHTVSVFLLGLTTLFLSHYVLPEKIYPVLGVISGVSIIWIGAVLLAKRIRVALGSAPVVSNALVHDHGDGHVHSHVPEGDVSMAGLIALGASGGLVPCPSALVLLLSSVALGRVGLGLTLLVAFSAGLAVVLSAIGMVVLFAKSLLPDSQKAARNPAFRYIPVASAAIIVCAGILMTGVALGVIRPFAGI